MCGITAVIALAQLPTRDVSSSKSRQSTERQLHQSLDQIQHRGPDSRGIWTSDNGRVALAHTRLAIKDLSPSGAQPLHSSNGVLHVIVNGEFYNYSSLRASLTDAAQGTPYEFSGNSDSELVLALYQRHGLRCFESLRGEFAFVLYDAARHLVVAARDRFGVKPLFWTIADGRLMFASEAKAFKPLGWNSQWDVESIVDEGWLCDERTIFKDVKKILPGQYMVCHKYDYIQHGRYWEVSFPDKVAHDVRSENDMINGLHARLVDAVEARLQADVPMGVYLSGGIDSAAVAGIATDLLRKKRANKFLNTTSIVDSEIDSPLICFNVGFDAKTEYDETAIARRTADFLGLPFYSERLDEAKFAANFEACFMHCEHHNPDLNSVAKFMLSGLARSHGVKVILSGEGSDEHFGGYGLFLPEFLREPDRSFGYDPLTTEERAAHTSHFESATAAIYKGVPEAQLPKPSPFARSLTNDTLITHTLVPTTLAPLSGWAFNPGSTSSYSHGVDSNFITAAVSRAQNVSSALELSRIAHQWHPLHTAQHIWTRTILSNFILTCMGDRMEMSHSVEGRPVFLDHHLVDFANFLPPSMKIKYTVPPQRHDTPTDDHIHRSDAASPPESAIVIEKYILREAARPYLTDEMYHRKKFPFTAPWQFFAGGPLHVLMQRLVTRENVMQLGFVEVDAAMDLLPRAFPEAKSGLQTDGLALRMCLVVAQWVVLSRGLGISRAVPFGQKENDEEEANYRRDMRVRSGVEWAWA